MVCDKLADRHYVLEQGRVVYEGSAADFRADPSIKNRYLALSAWWRFLMNSLAQPLRAMPTDQPRPLVAVADGPGPARRHGQGRRVSPGLTDLDRQARDLFVQWCEAAGCSVSVDAIGNIFARRPGRNPACPR